MTNTPRSKGTGAESMFVNWMHAHGESQVERHSLHGRSDLGDINGMPGLVTSVKFVGKGKPMNLSGWLNDLEVMKRNVHKRHPELGEVPEGILVVRRTGYPDVGDWYAVQRWGNWWSTFSEAFLT